LWLAAVVVDLATTAAAVQVDLSREQAFHFQMFLD
jgi:hypothetical protein